MGSFVRGYAPVAAIAGALFMAGSAANAQYSTNFEPEVYHPGILTGQDGWLNPVAGSNDFNVLSYPGNAPGFVLNPTGGDQFAYGALVTNLGRAQHNAAFSANTSYTIAFDQAVLPWNGTPPETAQDNISSVSLQSSATDRSMQSLAVWQNVADPAAGWQQRIGAVDAAGTGGHAVSFFDVGPAWQNLLLNHWYRFSISFDMNTNQLTSTSVTDLHSGTTTSEDLTDNGLYLTGGANNVLGYTLPTALRMFAGGGSGAPTSAGNRIGFDNVSLTVVPGPGAAALLGLGAMAGLRRRRV